MTENQTNDEERSNQSQEVQSQIWLKLPRTGLGPLWSLLKDALPQHSQTLAVSML
jgi:hypothetical protein